MPMTQTAAFHHVQTPLGRLHVVATGSGAETIVLWPSIFTDHRIYDDLVRRLGTRYRFLLIDGPGHGGSDGPQQAFPMAQCAHALATILDHFKLDAAIIGGTSWGGLAAAELALQTPARVQSLLLINTPMEIGSSRPNLSTRFIALGARWMLRTKLFRNGVARSFFKQQALDQNPTYKTAFHDMLASADPIRLSAAVRSVILTGQPLKPRTANLTVPTLVIAGKQDAMYPIATQAEAALLAPFGRFEPVPGKHISVVEQPAAVADIIDGFIARKLAA